MAPAQGAGGRGREACGNLALAAGARRRSYPALPTLAGAVGAPGEPPQAAHPSCRWWRAPAAPPAAPRGLHRPARKPATSQAASRRLGGPEGTSAAREPRAVGYRRVGASYRGSSEQGRAAREKFRERKRVRQGAHPTSDAAACPFCAAAAQRPVLVHSSPQWAWNLRVSLAAVLILPVRSMGAAGAAGDRPAAARPQPGAPTASTPAAADPAPLLEPCA